jgi:hypothetical protein
MVLAKKRSWPFRLYRWMAPLTRMLSFCSSECSGFVSGLFCGDSNELGSTGGNLPIWLWCWLCKRRSQAFRGFCLISRAEKKDI